MWESFPASRISVSRLLRREYRAPPSTFPKDPRSALRIRADERAFSRTRPPPIIYEKPLPSGNPIFPEIKNSNSTILSRNVTKDVPLDRIFRGPYINLHPFFRRGHYITFNPRQQNCLGGTEDSQRQRNPAQIMKFWVQVLSTPTADTPGTTLVLHFDRRRYLIGNVGEGTQRAAVQRKLGLIKVQDIFLTGPIGWGNAGGLLGMILTIADASASSREQSKIDEAKKKKKNKKLGNPEKKIGSTADEEEKAWLSIHGGRNLTHLLATARRFIFRKGMPLRTTEFRPTKGQRGSWDPTWQDDLVKVWDMVIEPQFQPAARRKRSHEEYCDDTRQFVTGMNNKESAEEREDRYNQTRKSVVSSMFDSKWRLDSLIKVRLSEVALPAAIFIRNTDGSISKYRGPLPGDENFEDDFEVLVRTPWPGALVEALPPTAPSVTSVCYIIKGHPQRGKFNTKAANDLGVKPGPDFRRLTLGESVTTATGNVVTPDMVMSPTKEGTGFAIVELPTTSYIGPLLRREEWSSKEVMAGVAAIVWILGPGVVEDKKLQTFMADCKEIKHIVSSKDCCPNYLTLESPASAAIRLNLLDAERFPVPNYNNDVSDPQPAGERPYDIARPGLTLQLEPKVEFQEANLIQHLDTEAVIKEMPEEVLKLAEISRAEVMSPEYQAKLDEKQKDIPSKDAEIVTLGTGSALPSKYRNVSATLIRVPGYGTYLLDCGENTLGQLKRVYGDQLPEVLRDLKVIWISHLHADHHLGTVNVIKAWAAETAKHDSSKGDKLYVISHEGMTHWLKEYSEVEDYGYERLETRMVARSKWRSWEFDHQFEPEEVNNIGISSIQACPVEHCHGAAAVVINFPNGFKIAYSGDCRPSDEFVKIGQGTTLLIHEATFDDELQGDAIAKKHSTTAEALDVGKRMNARRILLTHFSQRYQKIPVMDSEGGKDQVAIVAFDYMKVKLGDFAKVDAFKPALMKLYEEEDENGENEKGENEKGEPDVAKSLMGG